MVSWWMQEMCECTVCKELRPKWLATYKNHRGFTCKTCTDAQALLIDREGGHAG